MQNIRLRLQCPNGHLVRVVVDLGMDTDVIVPNHWEGVIECPDCGEKSPMRLTPDDIRALTGAAPN